MPTRPTNKIRIIINLSHTVNQRVKKMKLFLCNSSSSPLSLPPPITTLRRLPPPNQPPLLRSLTGVALSVTLFLSPLTPPPSIASDFTPLGMQSECREDDQRKEQEMKLENAPELVTNLEIVKEAWEIVNDSFLGSDRYRWSPESWLQKKEDIMSMSLPTRSKAHNVIRRMLSSLGDRYTRFLSPEEVVGSFSPNL